MSNSGTVTDLTCQAFIIEGNGDTFALRNPTSDEIVADVTANVPREGQGVG